LVSNLRKLSSPVVSPYRSIGEYVPLKPVNEAIQKEYIYGDIKVYYTVHNADAHIVHIVKNGVDTLLNITIPFDAPGARLPEFHTTNNPDIGLITSGIGDMGGVWHGSYYINLKTDEVTQVSYTNSPSLMVNDQTITLSIEDPCGYKLGRLNGEEAKVTGLVINDKKVAYTFAKPYILTCVDPGGIGSIYSPELTIKNISASDDISKVYFTFAAENWSNSQPDIIWEDKFTLDIASQKISKR
jgi:hypothetical protein